MLAAYLYILITMGSSFLYFLTVSVYNFFLFLICFAHYSRIFIYFFKNHIYSLILCMFCLFSLFYICLVYFSFSILYFSIFTLFFVLFLSIFSTHYFFKSLFSILHAVNPDFTGWMTLRFSISWMHFIYSLTKSDSWNKNGNVVFDLIWRKTWYIFTSKTNV